MTKEATAKSKINTDENQKAIFDDALRKMLSTPPKPESKKHKTEQNKKTVG